MKKALSLVLAVVLCLGAVLAFSSCTNTGSDKTDWENIQAKGKFVVGYTIYDPMNYKDENDKLIGFDTEFAELVAKELGVNVEFQLIKWENKYIELNSGKVDALWNGFTANCADDDGVARSEKVDFSIAYMDNAQCVVVKSDALESYKTAADLAGKTCAVESGSAGETYAKSVTDEAKVLGKDSQIDAFTELGAGTVDFIVVDVYLANSMVGKGNYTSIAKATAIEIEKEEYAIGFRKGSDFKAKVDEIINKTATNGELEKIAAKYNLNLTEALEALNTSEKAD